MKLLATLLAFLGMNIASANTLPLGSDLPKVSVNDEAGKVVNLAEKKEGWVLVYFYPKADTPGCTKQACSLRDAYAKLTDAHVQIFGVSFDKEEAQKAFKEKYKLPFTLLADVEGKVAAAFGVPSVAKIAKRQAYLFQAGKLKWKDEAASTDQQAADVLKVLGQ